MPGLRLQRTQPRGDSVASDEFTRFQADLARVLDAKAMAPATIKAALGSGYQNLISHGLGHRWAGWRIVDQDAAAIVWRDSTATLAPEIGIALLSTLPVNVVLEVW